MTQEDILFRDIIIEYRGKAFVRFSIYLKVYLVFSNGTVYSVYRSHGWKYPRTKKIERSTNYKNQYITYKIKENTVYKHRLVAKLFIPPIKNKNCVNHKDGDKSNNCISNLEWVTYSENHKHAYSKLGRVSAHLKKDRGGGVHFRKDRNYWIAYCSYNKKRKYLGSFETEKDARRAVNEYRKEFTK